MSATGRSDVRIPADFYSTPPAVVRAILRVLDLRAGSVVLDPSCGDGAILDVADAMGCATVGIELDAGRAIKAQASGRVVEVRDALSADAWPRADVIVMNPPYSLAMDFVLRALAEAKPQGIGVVALLRLAWLESAGRAAFHRANPSDAYVLSERPSFAASLKCKGTKTAKPCGWRTMQPLADERPKTCPACGGGVLVTTSDSSAYAWFCHAPWNAGRPGSWSILDTSEAA